MSDPATRQVKSVILQTTVASAALGVILSPIPLADELLLVPIYGVMTARISRARGVGLTRVPWRPIGAAIVAGLAARAAANVGFAFIPGVAAVANALSAAALTKVLGEYADTACQKGAAPWPFASSSSSSSASASPAAA
jgi:uncharacterized protein (DUF697 family)